MPNSATSSLIIEAPPLAPALGRFHAEIVERPDRAWDALAAHFSDMSMEQSFAFADSRWSRLNAVGLVLREGENIAAMALALIAKVPVLGTGLAYVKFGPLWRAAGKPANADVLRAMLKALKLEFAIKRGLVLRILPPADPEYADAWLGELSLEGFVLRGTPPDPERYLVNLGISEEEQLASLGAQWRANLKKVATDLVIEEPGLQAGIPVFLALYKNMLARKKFADHHGVEDISTIAEEAEALGMRLFIASHRGEPVVGSILIGAGERIFVPFSATSDRALSLRAGYGLRWGIINKLRGTKARWLDLGGVEGDQGLRHYKLGNVGKRGRVVSIPGEYDFAPNALSAAAARAIGLGRDLVRTPALKKLVTFLPI